VIKAATGGCQVVLLIDVTHGTGAQSAQGSLQIAKWGVPDAFRGLVVPYSSEDIFKVFQNATSKLTSSITLIAREKYYESFSFSWWYAQHGNELLEWMWNMEDDVTFTGSWMGLFNSLRSSLRNQTDLLLFDDFCTPSKKWMWANKHYTSEKPELTVDGKALAGQVMFFGSSRRYLESLVAQQHSGFAGHVEWWIPTAALQGGLNLAYVDHIRDGRHRSNLKHEWSKFLLGAPLETCDAQRVLPGEPTQTRLGTYNIANKLSESLQDARTWYLEWRQNDRACKTPLILHPVKYSSAHEFQVRSKAVRNDTQAQSRPRSTIHKLRPGNHLPMPQVHATGSSSRGH
jgi:hypothetical protein